MLEIISRRLSASENAERLCSDFVFSDTIRKLFDFSNHELILRLMTTFSHWTFVLTNKNLLGHIIFTNEVFFFILDTFLLCFLYDLLQIDVLIQSQKLLIVSRWYQLPKMPVIRKMSPEIASAAVMTAHMIREEPKCWPLPSQSRASAGQKFPVRSMNPKTDSPASGRIAAVAKPQTNAQLCTRGHVFTNKHTKPTMMSRRPIIGIRTLQHETLRRKRNSEKSYRAVFSPTPTTRRYGSHEGTNRSAKHPCPKNVPNTDTRRINNNNWSDDIAQQN